MSVAALFLPWLNNVAATLLLLLPPPSPPIHPSIININDRCLSIAVADYAGRSLRERSLGLVERKKERERKRVGRKQGRKSNGKSSGEIGAIREGKWSTKRNRMGAGFLIRGGKNSRGYMQIPRVTPGRRGSSPPLFPNSIRFSVSSGIKSVSVSKKSGAGFGTNESSLKDSIRRFILLREGRREGGKMYKKKKKIGRKKKSNCV